MIDLYQAGSAYGRAWVEAVIKDTDTIGEWVSIPNLQEFRKALVMANSPLFAPAEHMHIDDYDGELWEAAVHSAWQELTLLSAGARVPL